ncbi:MAG TPA: M1 family aminopeptidase [Vicinamibacterales bacterium]|nr:M1 family aminopeptidase [Vicinamibacterales bacterium]
MARRLAPFLIALVVGIGVAVYLVLRREPPPPGAGVPLALAEDRAARVSSLRYELTFHIPSKRDEPIPAHLTAAFALRDNATPLAFDFAQGSEHLKSVQANGREVAPRVQNGHLVIPARALAAGDNTVEIEFIAGDDSLNRNDDYMYTLFVPARASLALPCFDQPDLKARWRLSLEVPPDWTAVSNGRETGRTVSPDRLGLIFDETPPIPTYLFAFAAGKFSIETAERNGRTFRMFHRETDAAKVARNRNAIFDLHARALAWLEDYTTIPYPWGKFDFVLIPSFQFGGMEHPGAIYYNASSLMLDESATQNQQLGRANTISHETSHMWFGDFVTMKWFNDVWMKEVFANFMAAKIVNPSFPTVNHDLRFLFQNYPVAYEVDRTDGANPIRQELANLNEAGSLYGAIIYQKAPIVMRQLELLMGADEFRDGLREYLKAHAFGNATWTDLVSVLDVRTPADLAAWSKAWVDERGRPTIRTNLDVANGRITNLSFHEEDARGRHLFWAERLQVLVGGPAGSKTFDVTLDGPDTAVPDAVGLPAPKWVLPVGRGLGYGFFDLDRATLEYLTTSLPTIADPLTRGAALVALWECMLEGRVAPARVLEELLTSLQRETDELNVQHLLDLTRTAFWRYTAADDRAAAATKLEATLRAGLDRAKPTSAKAAWFNTLRGVATTPETVAWLEQIWAHQTTVPGLPLSENDEVDLALELALRGVADAPTLLETELTRVTNPDRKARFLFLMPSVSGDQAARDAFFDSLKDVNTRKHEAWVLDAMRYLNHPLRAAQSKKYVRPALELVREIQRTGDIFFPKRWADAAMSGYQSVQTAADVRDVIDHLPPDYPQRLRWVLLASADPLFRAAKLLSQ